MHAHTIVRMRAARLRLRVYENDPLWRKALMHALLLPSTILHSAPSKSSSSHACERAHTHTRAHTHARACARSGADWVGGAGAEHAKAVGFVDGRLAFTSVEFVSTAKWSEPGKVVRPYYDRRALGQLSRVATGESVGRGMREASGGFATTAAALVLEPCRLRAAKPCAPSHRDIVCCFTTRLGRWDAYLAAFVRAAPRSLSTVFCYTGCALGLKR
eukprot:6190568-Pleurochrysis_carterae.AAC.2